MRRRNGCGGGCRKRSGGNNGCGAEWVRIGDRLRRVFQKNQFRSDPSLRNWLQTIRLNQNARSKSVCPLEIIDIHYIRRASREIIPVFIAGAGNYQRIAALCGFSLLVIPVNLYFQVFDCQFSSLLRGGGGNFERTVTEDFPFIDRIGFLGIP